MKLASSFFSTVLVAAIFSTACVKPKTSGVKELERVSGVLHLQERAGGFKFGEAFYTLYEDGTMSFHGDVAILLPGTSVEFTLPFNKRHLTDYTNFLSSYYRESVGKTKAMGRLNVTVNSVSEDLKRAYISGVFDVRQTHWTDKFYGADRIDAELDISGKWVKFVNIKIINGHVFFKGDTRDYLPPYESYSRFFTIPSNFYGNLNLNIVAKD